MQPPSQELLVRDLHDNTWTFRHIYRGECCFDYLPSVSSSNLIRTTTIIKIAQKENWQHADFVTNSVNNTTQLLCRSLCVCKYVYNNILTLST